MGADDVVENDDDNTVVVECKPNMLHSINEALKKENLNGKIELTYKPIVGSPEVGYR